MKARFIGKAKWYTGSCDFTVGKDYELSHQGGNFYSTVDDNGVFVYFENERYYGFEIHKDEPKYDALTYTMNGVAVTKQFFEDKLAEVEALKSKGVSVFIDFEVSF